MGNLINSFVVEKKKKEKRNVEKKIDWQVAVKKMKIWNFIFIVIFIVNFVAGSKRHHRRNYIGYEIDESIDYTAEGMFMFNC